MTGWYIISAWVIIGIVTTAVNTYIKCWNKGIDIRIIDVVDIIIGALLGPLLGCILLCDFLARYKYKVIIKGRKIDKS